LISTAGEVIDLRPFVVQQELKASKEQQTWTPEPESVTSPVKPVKKRKHIQIKSTEAKSSKPNKKRVVVSKVRERTRSVTPVPRLSEYEKMQLLIADAASEANSLLPRARRSKLA
jgi:hypothetical protein